MPKNLRDLLMAGASRLIVFAADGDDEPAGGGGGAPPAAEPPAGEAPPAPEGETPPAGGDGGEGGDPPAAAAGGEEEPPPKPARVPWQVDRINKLTAANKTAQEEADAAKRETAAAKEQLAAYEALYGKQGGDPPAPAPPAPAAPGSRVYTEADVQSEAQRIAQVNVLNQKCETLFETGAKSHEKTWAPRVVALAQAFGADLQKRPDFFEAVTALPNSADVYHELAGDLDHMAEVLALPPVRLGMELAGISAKLASKAKGPAVSRAPVPIDPVDGGSGGGGAEDLSEVPMDQYAATRERQREERFKARGY